VIRRELFSNRFMVLRPHTRGGGLFIAEKWNGIEPPPGLERYCELTLWPAEASELAAAELTSGPVEAAETKCPAVALAADAPSLSPKHKGGSSDSGLWAPEWVLVAELVDFIRSFYGPEIEPLLTGIVRRIQFNEAPYQPEGCKLQIEINGHKPGPIRDWRPIERDWEKGQAKLPIGVILWWLGFEHDELPRELVEMALAERKIPLLISTQMIHSAVQQEQNKHARATRGAQLPQPHIILEQRSRRMAPEYVQEEPKPPAPPPADPPIPSAESLSASPELVAKGDLPAQTLGPALAESGQESGGAQAPKPPARWKKKGRRRNTGGGQYKPLYRPAEAHAKEVLREGRFTRIKEFRADLREFIAQLDGAQVSERTINRWTEIFWRKRRLKRWLNQA
jgi:hypothetical protein